MRVAAYFSSPQYARHGLPIVDALRRRGVEVDVWARDSGSPWGPPVVEQFRHRVAPLVIVASHQDAIRWRDRPLVYVEHGAGQSYDTTGLQDPERLRLGFSGGGGLDHVRLFLCPSERVADRWRAAYPQAAVDIVGCPALDRYAGCGLRAKTFSAKPTPRTVAITAHHPTFGAVPECRPALPHFDAALPHLRIDLARAGIELVGHAHPRGVLSMIRRWENLGIRYEPDPDYVLRTTYLLIADNTSLMYEAAAVDLPVLALNAPWYRREVEHGLRFWSHVPGLQCDEPSDLARMVYEALSDPPEASALRTRAAAYAYALLDGHAADRAAQAIIAIEGAPMPDPLAETNSRTDEVIDRLYQLGATEELVAKIRDARPDVRDAEVDRLRRLNDSRLAAEISQALDPPAFSRVDPVDADLIGNDDYPTEAELDDAARELLVAESDDQVIDAVGADADLAARVFRLESQSEDPSPGLLQAVAAVAGIDYTAPPEAPSEPEGG